MNLPVGRGRFGRDRISNLGNTPGYTRAHPRSSKFGSILGRDRISNFRKRRDCTRAHPRPSETFGSAPVDLLVSRGSIRATPTRSRRTGLSGMLYPSLLHTPYPSSAANPLLRLATPDSASSVPPNPFGCQGRSPPKVVFAQDGCIYYTGNSYPIHMHGPVLRESHEES